MGQYVKRGGKTYYKGDDGKLYKDYSAALAAANKPQTGFEYGLSLLGVRPDRSQQSGLEYGMSQLAGLAGVPGQPETGLQYGLQKAGNLFNRFARGANAAQLAPTDAQLRAEGYGDLINDAARLRSPTDAQLRAEGYGDLVNDAARLRAPTDAQLRAEGYGDLINDAARLRKPVITPAGVVQPGVIVKGLTPAGTVDYSQGDEYKAQLAQYRNLIQQQKRAEAEDLGMKIFMQKYAKSPIAQAGGAVGAFNPLLAATFPETKGYTGTFAAEEEPLYGRDLGASAQGELGPTMESLNPLASQAAQQEATATQADMATTAGLSAGDRTRAFLRAVRQGTI